MTDWEREAFKHLASFIPGLSGVAGIDLLLRLQRLRVDFSR